MAVPRKTIWTLAPHSSAKHKILRNYLDAWFPILITHNGRIVYLDGFSGPGLYAGGEPGSPIVALQSALAHKDRLKGEVGFFFIEEDRDRASHLESEIAKLNLPSNFKVVVECGQFAERFGAVLQQLDKGGLKLAPTFALIDPFGFAGLPYSLIKKLLSHPKCEVLITFMVDSINRWLEHPDEAIKTRIIETSEAISVAQSSQRIEGLRDLYLSQLKRTARFVRYFEMSDVDKRVVYYLFFASNNALGHTRMKEAMWRVDPDGDFTFSDSTDPKQHILFAQPPAEDVSEHILRRFKGASRLPVSQIETFVNDETAYLAKHMREALKLLEDRGVAIVEPLKSDGEKRRRSSFPGNAMLSFR